MKLHAARYGVTTAMCVLAVCSMSIAADITDFKWAIAVIGAIGSGLLSCIVIPYDQRGDK